MLVAYRAGTRAVFLYAFAKNERENIDPGELLTLREIGPAGWRRVRNRSRMHSPKEFCRRWPMAAKQKQPSRLTKVLLETADDMRRAGIMDAMAHAKITLRYLGDKADVVTEPIGGDDIRKLREQAHMSQAVFARYLNLTVGYVSQLERGAKRPTGPALVLLNVIRRKGIKAIL